MIWKLAAGLVLLVACGTGQTAPPSAPAAAQERLAITPVTVVDMTEGALRPGQTVLIQGDRITAVGPVDKVDVPGDARVIDSTDRFLIPGLWDMLPPSCNSTLTRALT